MRSFIVRGVLLVVSWFEKLRCDGFVTQACQDGTASAELQEHSWTSPSPVKHIWEASFHGLLRQTVPEALQQVPLSPALPQTVPDPQLDALSKKKQYRQYRIH